jgi:hypothetical protein
MVKIKEDKVHIEYKKKRNDTWDDFSLTCHQAPAPGFVKAIDDLRPHVVEICELPKDYVSGLTVTGVTYTYAGDADIMAATIIAKKTLNSSNSPLLLNTPHKPSDADEKGAGSPVLSSACVKILKKLQKEAIEYINGKRAQLEMQLDEVAAKREEAASLEDYAVKAEKLIKDTGRASVTLLKRQLGIKMGQATKVMDILEKNGLVGPPMKGGTREIIG